MILRAPLIYPVDAPPIENGAVLVEGDTIRAVGPAKDIESPRSDRRSLDLPSSILLPGFVNAHSHLELTSLEGLSNPGGFADWIRRVVETKPKISDQDYEKGIEEGIRRMIQSGITTVGDHVSFNTDLETILNSPLRGVLFVEVLGVVKEVAEDLFKAAQEFERLYQDSPRFRVTATPHSVHALHPEILPQIFEGHHSVLSIHLGESEEEDRYFRDQSGPLFELIQQRGGTGPTRKVEHMGSPLQKTGIQYLNRLGLLSDQIMAVHGNYLDATDLNLLAQHGISVVHCPSSHAYFKHKKFPLEILREKNMNIALGTDSLASSHTLSMLDELRIAQENYPGIVVDDWIRMATLGGAKALKMEESIGSITPAKKADLIAFQIPDIRKQNLSETLGQIIHSQNAHFVMIDGKIIS